MPRIVVGSRYAGTSIADSAALQELRPVGKSDRN